jgi:hypothetical protein
MDPASRLIYLGITIIALGVVMTSAMGGLPRPVGLVFIGIGGVLFILGMRRRRDDHSGSG